jgi:hypothetical protein
MDLLSCCQGLLWAAVMYVPLYVGLRTFLELITDYDNEYTFNDTRHLHYGPTHRLLRYDYTTTYRTNRSSYSCPLSNSCSRKTCNAAIRNAGRDGRYLCFEPKIPR